MITWPDWTVQHYDLILTSVYCLIIGLLITREVRSIYERYSLRRRYGAEYARSSAEWPFGLDYVEANDSFAKSFTNLEFARQRTQKYGTTHGASVLGQYNIFTIDPVNVNAILSTQFNEFGKGGNFRILYHELLGDGIFAADGAKWKEDRALLRPHFSRSRVSDTQSLEAKVLRLRDRIEVGKVIDCMPLWSHFAFEVSMDYLFGLKTEALTDVEDPFARIFAQAQELQAARARSGPFRHIYFLQRRSLNKQIAKLDDELHKYISLAANAKSAVRQTSLLANLVRDTTDRVVIRDSLVSSLLAGRDTVAATLCWMFKELSASPSTWTAVREEVFAHVGEAQPSSEDLRTMQLVQAVVKETLRMYPIVPFNSRTSFRHTTLPRGGGPTGADPIVCPNDTQVVYSALQLHRSLSLEPSASTWHPERWLGPDAYKPEPGTFIPFNAGPRLCIGQQFAMTQMTYVLVRMAQWYERMDNCDAPLVGTDLGYTYDFLLRPRFGSKIRFWDSSGKDDG